jgi:DHA3 family macrolide efflux protein-like MFS transporter
VSLLGDFVAVFAVQVAVTFRMHGSARDMAGVFVAGLIPGMILGPFAGGFADRWDPRRTMIASDLARGLLILPLAFAVNLPRIYAISFAIGCVSSFFGPALAITVPLLVPRDGLAAAIARLQQSMQVVRIASPAVAAALVGWLGERACYYADSASFLFSAALLATLRCSRPASPSAPRQLSAGIRFLVHDFRADGAKLSFLVLALAAGTFAGSCFGAVASVYVRDILHRGPSVLALIGSLIGAGTVAGAAVMRRVFNRFHDPSALVRGGMTVVGASILAFALLPNEPTALIAAAAMGLGVAVVMVAATAMLQGQTPPELRGRISGVSASLTSFAQLSAMLLAGTWAAWIGIRGVFVVSAALLFATGFLAARNPRRRPVSARAANSRSAPGDS